MRKQIEVAAAVIIRGGRALAALRSEAMSLPGLWEFPGGKVEPGESLRVALVRELQEELGCRVVVGAHIETTIHAYDFGTVALSTFYASIERGEARAVEHSELRWCTATDLRALEWAPADQPAVTIVAADLSAKQL